MRSEAVVHCILLEGNGKKLFVYVRVFLINQGNIYPHFNDIYIMIFGKAGTNFPNPDCFRKFDNLNFDFPIYNVRNLISLHILQFPWAL